MESSLYVGGEGSSHSSLHANAAALAFVIARHVLGVTPLGPGFSRISVNPRIGGLKGVKGDPIVLLMHVPLWVERLDVFTCGCPTWGSATDPYWEIERRGRWASSQSPSTFAFRDAVLATPNLVGVFAGHVHRPSAVHASEDQLLFTVPINREGAAFDVRLLPYALH